ncbi:MAG: PQQ-binding-like beta-propeller repeat protein, partial [Rhodanobacteraceae bacterium]
MRAFIAAGALLAVSFANAQIDVVTERYDDVRTGANLAETTLNTSNVNVDSFGKLWSYTVSGSVYAQPLYVRNVDIAGGTHNVLYVVTMNDIVYAFDADSGDDTPLLTLDVTSMVVPNSIPVPVRDILGFDDNIIGNVGIESTPVIDLATNTMYFVARTEEPGGAGCTPNNETRCVQRLHAIDIRTLEEKPGSP